MKIFLAILLFVTVGIWYQAAATATPEVAAEQREQAAEVATVAPVATAPEGIEGEIFAECKEMAERGESLEFAAEVVTAYAMVNGLTAQATDAAAMACGVGYGAGEAE